MYYYRALSGRFYLPRTPQKWTTKHKRRSSRHQFWWSKPIMLLLEVQEQGLQLIFWCCPLCKIPVSITESNPILYNTEHVLKSNVHKVQGDSMRHIHTCLLKPCLSSITNVLYRLHGNPTMRLNMTDPTVNTRDWVIWKTIDFPTKLSHFFKKIKNTISDQVYSVAIPHILLHIQSILSYLLIFATDKEFRQIRVLSEIYNLINMNRNNIALSFGKVIFS